MAKRLFERCPECETDLSNALSRYFWEALPGIDFEYTCGGCGAVLEIEVESLPQFYCTTKVIRPTKRAADVCNAGDCEKPAVCAGLCEDHSF